MLCFRSLGHVLLAAIVCAVIVLPFGGIRAWEYEPHEGQEGKDVVWVPTSPALVEKMLDMAKVTSRDYVMDLGSGDGRTVIAAAKRGARAEGIEYNSYLVALSIRKAAEAGVSSKTSFKQEDFFTTDFSRATVITMFLLPNLNLQLRPRLLELKPGTRIVSNSFDMGEWKPDRTENLEKDAECLTFCTAYLWIVPARAQGVWTMPDGQLILRQEFQRISGELRNAHKVTPINGEIRGRFITFSSKAAVYAGEIRGSLMRGSKMSGGRKALWKADYLRAE